ncbi:MAG: hypothetical protein KKH76_02210, partial [Euryarchaeota archaeon]|nr:hypothetical protein [Euryarchaeota archaeon]
WFYYLAFPVAMMAFLTRYTAGLILFPMILYIVISRKYLSHFKKMIGGIITAFLVLLPFLVYNYQNIGDPIAPFLNFFSGSESSGAESIAFEPSPLYYLTNLPSYIASQGEYSSLIVYLIITLLLVGISIYVYDLIREKLMRNRVKGKVSKILEIERTGTKIKLIFFIIFLLIFIATFNCISYMASELVFLLLSYVAFTLLKDISGKKIEMDLLFLAWFMTYFIFHSTFAVKVDRYFVTMFPSFTYFVILGLNEIVNKLKVEFRGLNLTSTIITFFLILTIFLSIISTLNAIPDDPILLEDQATANETKALSEWIIKNDPDYSSKLIYSDFWPYASWYLQMNVKTMPIFKDKRSFGHELNKYSADYYVTYRSELNLTSYEEVKRAGKISVYRRIPEKSENLTSFLYIGKNWQNYVEDVLDFKAFVYRNESLYIDDYTLEDIKNYEAVLIYNFRWHNQKDAEQLIRDYLNSGGTVIIDTSGNLNGITYNLDNTIFLDTHITRRAMRTNPLIEINPKIRNQELILSPFESEDGNTWYGANYEPFGGNKIENLVTADGKTLIGIQKVGKGRIIWIGYNLVWHSFIMENMGERKLIEDIIFGRN